MAMQPVRKIKNNSGQVIGKFPSQKVERAISYESTLEADFIEHLEGDPDVLIYCEQPEKVGYSMNGQSHYYTPDFKVIRRSGQPQIVEVKPQNKTKKPEFNAMIRAVAPIFRQRGEEFFLATEKTIRRQPRLNNLRILRRYSRGSVSVQDHIEMNAFLSKRKTATVAEISAALAAKGMTVEKIFSLIYRGFLSVDLDKELRPDSVVTLKGGSK